MHEFEYYLFKMVYWCGCQCCNKLKYRKKLDFIQCVSKMQHFSIISYISTIFGLLYIYVKSILIKYCLSINFTDWRLNNFVFMLIIIRIWFHMHILCICICVTHLEMLKKRTYLRHFYQIVEKLMDTLSTNPALLTFIQKLLSG